MKSLAFSQKIKLRIIPRPSRFTPVLQKKLKTGTKASKEATATEIRAHPCSSQHYSQSPKDGNNPNVQMSTMVDGITMNRCSDTRWRRHSHTTCRWTSSRPCQVREPHARYLRLDHSTYTRYLEQVNPQTPARNSGRAAGRRNRKDSSWVWRFSSERCKCFEIEVVITQHYVRAKCHALWKDYSYGLWTVNFTSTKKWETGDHTNFRSESLERDLT